MKLTSLVVYLLVSWPTFAASLSSFPQRPKLVVFIAIDAFRYDYLHRFEPYFAPRGFKLLLSRGANFSNAHINHLRTSTGPAHAAMLTGASGSVSGIIDNEWWDRTARRKVNCVEDLTARMISSDRNDSDGEGRSPRKLLVTTVGDELRLATNFRSKVIGISYKDRGAILPGGKLASAAYWYDDETGSFVSSDFYMKELPNWVSELNANKLPDQHFNKKWERLLDEEAYGISREDDFEHELDYKGLGIVFPHVVNGNLKAPGPDFYKAFAQTPFADWHLAEFAKRAIESESLGMDFETDILALSFSATDRICHQFGPYSQEIQDQVLRMDRVLQDLFDFIDARLGLENTILVLTADHGSAPIPEYMARFKVDAGRIDKKPLPEDQDSVTIPATADSMLDITFGPENWVEAFVKPNIYLNRAAINKYSRAPGEIENAAATALTRIRGIGEVFTRSQLLTGALPATKVASMFVNQFNSERSGDLLVHNAPYYLTGSYKNSGDRGADHETAYDYDTHIPLIFFGQLFKPGIYSDRVVLNDLAPTLATILGVAFPSGNQGRVLSEALNRN